MNNASEKQMVDLNSTNSVHKSSKNQSEENKAKTSKARDPRKVLVNTIIALIITCAVLVVVIIVVLCIAIDAKKDVDKLYNYTGPSIIEEEEETFYFDGENFVSTEQ